MAWVETLCARCGLAYQTDLTTLSDKEEDDYASELQRAMAAAGSHWRVCKDCQEQAKAEQAQADSTYIFFKHPDDKAALLKMPEPGELDDPEFSSFKDFMEKNTPTKAQIGIWQGITFRRTD